MMKSILFTLLTLISVNSFAQITRVKFTDATFENGMLYPIAHLAGSEIIADKINKNI